MSKASELGSSLLASKQRRDDSFRKDREKWEKRQAFISLAAPALTTGLEAYAKRKDTDLLFSNPEVMEVASNFKIAGRNSAELLATEAAIAKAGITPNEYFFNQHKDSFRARAEAEIESRNDYQTAAIGDKGPFNKLIAEETRSLTDELAADYMTALASSRTIGSDADRAALLSDLTSSINPRRISGHIIKRARGLFGRKSQEELDAAAIEALSNSPIANNVANFNGFKKAYDKSKDIFSAFDMANLKKFTQGELAGLLRPVSTDTNYVISSDKRLTTQEVTVKENVNNGEMITSYGDFVTVFNNTDTADDRAAKALDVLMDNADTLEQMEKFGTPEALEIFVAEAGNLELSYMNPKTIPEYRQVQALGEEILNRDPQLYIKDEFENVATLELMRMQGTTMLQIETMIAQTSDDPVEVEAALARIDASMLQYVDQARNLNSLARGDGPLRKNNVPMPEGYGSTLTQEDWDKMNETQRAQFPPKN